MLGAEQLSQRDSNRQPTGAACMALPLQASTITAVRVCCRLPTRLHRRLRSRERSRGATVSDDRPRHRRTDERYPGPSERIRDNPPARRHRRSMHGTKSKSCAAAF